MVNFFSLLTERNELGKKGKKVPLRPLKPSSAALKEKKKANRQGDFGGHQVPSSQKPCQPKELQFCISAFDSLNYSEFLGGDSVHLHFYISKRVGQGDGLPHRGRFFFSILFADICKFCTIFYLLSNLSSANNPGNAILGGFDSIHNFWGQIIFRVLLVSNLKISSLCPRFNIKPFNCGISSSTILKVS